MAEQEESKASEQEDAGEDESKNYDAYGFQYSTTMNEASDYRSHAYNPSRINPSAALLEEWSSVVANWDVMVQFQPEKIAELLRAGVPNHMRSTVWSLMLDVPGIKKTLKIDYAAEQAHMAQLLAARRAKQHVLEENRRQWAARAAAGGGEDEPAPISFLEEDGLLPSVKAANQITLDLDRTFYTHTRFRERQGPGQQQLFRVLTLYARVCPRTGYCQGMAYVAAALLMFMEEEDAFWALAAMLERGKYLQNYYAEDLWHVQRDARVFQALLARCHPDLHAHLTGNDIHPLMYITQWFMCLFTALPLWDTTLAVWDLLLWEGHRALFRTALTIMDTCEAELMELASMGELLPYLQHLPVHKLDSAVFVPLLWALDEEELSSLIKEAEEDVRQSEAENEMPASIRRPRRQVESDATAVRKARPTEQPTSVLRRMFGSITTPMRAPVRIARDSVLRHDIKPSTPQRLPFEALQESLSPSFSRSGLLSPSFRGKVDTLLSPCSLQHLDVAPTETISFLNTASPTQVESFDAFKLRTPLRPTQAQTPAASKFTTKRGQEAAASTLRVTSSSSFTTTTTTAAATTTTSSLASTLGSSNGLGLFSSSLSSTAPADISAAGLLASPDAIRMEMKTLAAPPTRARPKGPSERAF